MKKFLTIILLSALLSVTHAQGKDTVIVSKLNFVVNTDSLIVDDNYREFKEKTLPYLDANAKYVEYIEMSGGASPEGPNALNKRLSDKRIAKAFSIISKSTTKFPVTASKGENYEGLYNIIYNSDEPYRDKVLEILSTSSNVKRDLKAHNGGKTWADMLKKYYPQLRSVTIRMRFSIPVPCEPQIDTILITERDTIYIHDTIYIEKSLRRIPILAVKTNLVSDVLITPNVQAELYTHLWGLSLEFDYTFPWFHKDYGTYFYYQLLNGTVGIRKYLNEDYTGHYFGIYANTAIYDFCPFDKDQGWQGEVYGCGLSYGHVFQNKKYPRIKFEPYVRFGWFNTKFDTYHASQPWNEKYYYNWYLRASDFVPRRFNMNYFGPTEIGFNFTFDLICLRRY